MASLSRCPRATDAAIYTLNVRPHPWCQRRQQNSLTVWKGPLYETTAMSDAACARLLSAGHVTALRNTPVPCPCEKSPPAFASRAFDALRNDPSGPDLLNHVIATGEAHLRTLHRSCMNCYNSSRTHPGIGKDAPFGRPTQGRHGITPMQKRGVLHHVTVRI
jgi:hypothetical protein